LKKKDILEQLDIAQEVSERKDKEIEIRFLTPMRFKIDGKLSSELTIRKFFSMSCLRLTELYAAHSIDDEKIYETEKIREFLHECENNIELISDLNWVSFSRYSRRQEKQMKLGGVMGRIKLKGELENLESFFKMIKLFSLGKNTSFGLGQLKIKNIK
jgi:hypothetical protein